MNRSARRLPGAVYASMLLLFLAAACGAPDDAATSGEAATPESAATDSDAIDVCNLFSAAEAEATLGLPVQDPEPSTYNPVGKVSECTYEAVESETEVGLLTIRVELPGNPEAARTRLEELLQPDDEVAGLGDHAFFSLGQLIVFDGPHQLMITFAQPRLPAEQRRDAAMTVAETVLSRL